MTLDLSFFNFATNHIKFPTLDFCHRHFLIYNVYVLPLNNNESLNHYLKQSLNVYGLAEYKPLDFGKSITCHKSSCLPRQNSSTGCIKHFFGFLLLVDASPYVTDIELRSKSL